MKMPAFEWVHVQLHQQKGMISLSPPTICNSALQPAEMLHVLGPFRREGGIERDFLAAHAATGARFIGVHGGVPPLVDEADEGRRRHRPGEQETLHRVATRLPQPRKAVGCFHTLGYHLHCRFQKTAALNVRSRLHYSSGGVGSIRQRRAAAGHQRTQGGLSATGRSMRHRWPSRRGSESARIDLRCPTSH
ncbi:hypothetical protein SK79_04859 [Escherichia coli]|nr:hypothetical protein SK79_04859 [Escherichia coli]